MDELRSGGTLLVHRLDRLGRSLAHPVCIVNRLGRHQVGLRSLHESIGTSTAVSRPKLHLFAELAGFECSLTIERTLDRQAAARQRTLDLTSERPDP